MAEILTHLGLHGLAVLLLIFNELSHIVEDGSCDEGVMVKGETAAVLVEGVVLVVNDLCHSRYAPVVDVKGSGAVGDKKCKGYLVHILGFPPACLQSVFYSRDDLVLELLVLDPFDLGDHFDDPVSHANIPPANIF